MLLGPAVVVHATLTGFLSWAVLGPRETEGLDEGAG